MKQHKNKIIAGVIILLVLAFAFWYGGNAPGLRGWTPQPKGGITVTPGPTPTASPQETSSPSPAPTEPTVTEEPAKDSSENIGQEVQTAGKMEIDPSTGKDQYLTDPVPEGKPLPIEPQDAVITDQAFTCTLSVRCDTILQNISWLDPKKTDLVPADGVIFAEKEVTFYEGESVFNVLLREMKRNKIHMEFENTPIYNSAYIEGINNLYEFDCGELSGWMYRVNGWFPNYGCSRYQLKPGDNIEWVYTCDLGADVGGAYSTKNGR